MPIYELWIQNYAGRYTVMHQHLQVSNTFDTLAAALAALQHMARERGV